MSQQSNNIITDLHTAWAKGRHGAMDIAPDVIAEYDRAGQLHLRAS